MDATTPLVSWSIAKSIPYARVGHVQGDGLLELHVVAPLVQWGIEAQNEVCFF